MTASQSNDRRFLGFDWPYLISEWKEALSPKTMLADLGAGLTVALVAVPLNLALGIAAGVEPGVGITTGIVASIIGSAFGGQKYAITGPAAAMAVVLIELAQEYGLAAIWLVGLIAGVLQIVSGALRLGRLISFIPMPVMVGFANAIGILVLFNALDDFLGLPIHKIAHAGAKPPLAGHPFVPEFIQDLISLFWNTIVHQQWNPYAVLIGAVVVVLAVFVPRWTKVIPGQLVAVVSASVIAALLHFKIPRIIDVAALPTSMPMPSLPDLPWGELHTLFASAVTVYMLASIESLLSASVADGMTMSRRHHSDQELIGQGLANVVTPFFGGIPVTGVIARTAVNIRAGAKTRLSGIVHAVVLMILSFSLAKYAEQIPLAALSGVLVLTGIRLFEWDASRQIWLASRTEGMVMVLTTCISVLVDLTAGVVTGLVLTAGLFIRQMSALKVVEHEYDRDRRSQVRQPVPTCKFVRTYLIDGPLFFGAAERFTENILLVQNLKAVILHMKAVNALDLTGAETILSIHAQLKRNGIRLVLAELTHQPFELLKRMGADMKLGKENLFRDFREAILSVNQQVLMSSCAGCAVHLNEVEKPPTSGVKDCMLRNALILNTDQIGNIMRQRMGVDVSLGSALAEKETFTVDFSRLLTLDKSEDIPEQLKGCPIEELISCHNFYQVTELDTDNTADLIIGMCVDYAKQLHLPKNAAYIVRSPGANMRDCEFSVALAVAAGLKHMALVVHNRCLMSDPFEQRDLVLETLCSEHGWQQKEAECFFDRIAIDKAIADPIDFGVEEAQRLRELFSGLIVVPFLYNVDDDRLYLIKEDMQVWQKPDQAAIKAT